MGILGKQRQLPPVWLFATMGIIVIAGFAFLTVKQFANDRALDSRGAETTATVTEVAQGKNSRIHVEFATADGRQVRALVAQGSEAPGDRPAVGERLPIRYDPERPTDDVRDTRAPDDNKLLYLTLAVTVLGALGVATATPLLAREHRRRREAAR